MNYVPIKKETFQEANHTMKEAIKKVNQLKEDKQELTEALDKANSRLLGVLIKMNDFLSHGLDVDLPTETDRDMTKRAYEESKAVLKKYQSVKQP